MRNIVTSECNGRKVYYDNGQWKYCDTNAPVTTPEEWYDRCSGDGYEKHERNTPNLRPCKSCNKFPSKEGDDWCIHRLGNVINACCGHGNRMGYIQFDNGYIIRGFFEISKKNTDGEYEVVVNHIRFRAMWFYIKRWIMAKLKIR